MKKNRGSILIVAVWALVFFTFLGAGFRAVLDSRVRMGRFYRERLAAEQAAYSACRRIQQELKNDRTGYDTLFECGRERTEECGLTRFTYSLVDEGRKVNINTGSPSVLAGLPGLTMDIAQKIASPDVRPFTLIEELAAVEGGAGVYETIRGMVTIHGEGAVNVNTAPEAVLKALGIDQAVIRKIMWYRKGADDREATADDGIFTETNAISSALESSIGLTSAEKMSLALILNQGLLRVSSDVFTALITVSYLDKEIAGYSIILDKHSIKQWDER